MTKAYDCAPSSRATTPSSSSASPATRRRTRTRLQRAGWRIIPVNPYADEILGERVYRSLADVKAAGAPLGLVEVFRPSAQAADVVRQAAEAGARTVWLQEGIISADGRAIAAAAGMDYVEDRCMAVIRGMFALAKAGGS